MASPALFWVARALGGLPPRAHIVPAVQPAVAAEAARAIRASRHGHTSSQRCNLGGSRARGTHSESSDYDLGLYYEKSISVPEIEDFAGSVADPNFHSQG